MSRFASAAGEAVAELSERVAEAGRLSRGRTLFRKGSVSDLTVGEGSVFASVRGSAGDPYETTVATDLAPPGVIRQVLDAHDPTNPMSLDDMIAEGIQITPRDIDLAFSCDCADWEEPCKHAIAVLLALADRVDLDEVELLRWRGIDLSISDPASAGDDRDGGADTGATEAADRTARLSELEALLGDTAVRVQTSGGPDPGRDATPLDPALVDFLGVGAELEPIDVDELEAAAPLFTDVHLGPLAELAPALADGLAIIIDRLEDRSTPRPDPADGSPAGRST